MAFTTIQGSGANDATTFVGTSGVDTILIQNVANPVFLSGLGANDVINFSNFTTLVSGYTLRGGDGDDTIGAALVPNITSSFINGNAGVDTITLTGVSNSTVFGGKGNDTIRVTNASNSRINGNEGNDVIFVDVASSSSIFGGKGQDNITVGKTAIANTILATVVQGDDDNDVITIATGTLLNGATINGNAGNDFITVNELGSFTASTIFGGAGDDTIIASTAKVGVFLSGDNGNDSIVGGVGKDTILGGAGDDTITGGDGADVLTGGAGKNRFIQGSTDGVASTSGATLGTFVFGNGVDVVTDFSSTAGNVLVAAAATSLTTTVADGVKAYRGSFNGTNTFVVSDQGADVLYGTVANATTNATRAIGADSIVLVGAAAGFTGTTIIA